MTKQEQFNKIEQEMENWLPKTGNMRKILEPVAKSSADYSQTVDSVYKSLILDTAATEEEIENIGRPLGVYKNTNEDINLYRARVESAYREIINNGSPADIIESISLILNISEQSVRLENNEGVTFEITVPLAALERKSLTESQVENIFSRLSAATYEVTIIGSGTLDYITPSEYQSGATTNGYADSTVDKDSDDRGTYSEIID